VCVCVVVVCVCGGGGRACAATAPAQPLWLAVQQRGRPAGQNQRSLLHRADACPPAALPVCLLPSQVKVESRGGVESGGGAPAGRGTRAGRRRRWRSRSRQSAASGPAPGSPAAPSARCSALRRRKRGGWFRGVGGGEPRAGQAALKQREVSASNPPLACSKPPRQPGPRGSASDGALAPRCTAHPPAPSAGCTAPCGAPGCTPPCASGSSWCAPSPLQGARRGAVTKSGIASRG
jgi:hypothetical protein